MGEIVANAGVHIDPGAPARQILEQTGIANKIASFDGMKVGRFRYMPNFDSAAAAAKLSLRHESENFDERMAPATGNDIVPTIAHALLRDRLAKRFYDVAKKDEVADVIAAAIDRQTLALRRTTHNVVEDSAIRVNRGCPVTVYVGDTETTGANHAGVRRIAKDSLAFELVSIV